MKKSHDRAECVVISRAEEASGCPAGALATARLDCWWKCQQQRDDPVALTLQTQESMVSSTTLLLLSTVLCQGKQQPVCLQIPPRAAMQLAGKSVEKWEMMTGGPSQVQVRLQLKEDPFYTSEFPMYVPPKSKQHPQGLFLCSDCCRPEYLLWQ